MPSSDLRNNLSRSDKVEPRLASLLSWRCADLTRCITNRLAIMKASACWWMIASYAYVHPSMAQGSADITMDFNPINCTEFNSYSYGGLSVDLAAFGTVNLLPTANILGLKPWGKFLASMQVKPSPQAPQSSYSISSSTENAQRNLISSGICSDTGLLFGDVSTSRLQLSCPNSGPCKVQFSPYMAWGISSPTQKPNRFCSTQYPDRYILSNDVEYCCNSADAIPKLVNTDPYKGFVQCTAQTTDDRATSIKSSNAASPASSPNQSASPSASALPTKSSLPAAPASSPSNSPLTRQLKSGSYVRSTRTCTNVQYDTCSDLCASKYDVRISSSIFLATSKATNLPSGCSCYDLVGNIQNGQGSGTGTVLERGATWTAIKNMENIDIKESIDGGSCLSTYAESSGGNSLQAPKLATTAFLAVILAACSIA
ncbi:hypothetical protein DFS34DRAFT_480728 [Phlyctochytrium arcticum]|nr:hypothetical protein DFS34DRAFT_480728 [Phlyctochytrium arcticum]